MESESVIEFFEYCWFEHEIFKIQASTRASQSIPASDPVQDQETSAGESRIGTAKINFARSESILVRSMSDQLSSQSSFVSGSPSPNSVLHHLPRLSQLHTVESGKEITEEVLAGSAKQEKARVAKLGRKKKRVLSKSLSELEFEEMKGFMDLGFVFSEEDKDSSLATIIPGLHRLGKKENTIVDDNNSSEVEEQPDPKSSNSRLDSLTVPRPYLSETWEWLDRKKKQETPLMNWNFPALNNETDMKDNLKWWAHTVASAVR